LFARLLTTDNEILIGMPIASPRAAWHDLFPPWRSRRDSRRSGQSQRTRHRAPVARIRVCESDSGTWGPRTHVGAITSSFEKCSRYLRASRVSRR
jgi:hypothetical protein